ncbi:unnamed protein product [Psylliodes chrysocephalus]|uniref:Uncharacterized protein n=1 Tax=Psylliodes chrysocephalus TaxID=3402493 RepID=A0A9P0GCF0_9CUCU|nr:unnamed protein product [Psylliodes chrysocephala]
MDEKTRVPLGIIAANAQAPILLHLDYRVKLPDHDFVVAEKHKFIPSVYAGIVIKKDGEGKPEAVTHSGPTYLAIRSGKHSSSNAETHATDIRRLSETPDFKNFMRTREGFVKPVFIFTCNGGPDENPRYERVIVSAIQHFNMIDLDGIYIATNAPGRNAFNRVKQQMAPLSRELTGVLLNMTILVYILIPVIELLTWNETLRVQALCCVIFGANCSLMIFLTRTINPTVSENYIKQKWKELTIKLNSKSKGPQLTTDKWIQRFSDWKYGTRFKYRKYLVKKNKTGEGPEVKNALTNLEKRAINAWGKVVVEGSSLVPELYGDIIQKTPTKAHSFHENILEDFNFKNIEIVL